MALFGLLRIILKTESDVKNAMKINYFDDKELIKEQSEKYSK